MSFVAPTEDEKTMVSKLKQRLREEAPQIQHQYSDTTVLRFYRGRDRDESKAMKALIKHVEWREANDVAGIMNKQEIFKQELQSGKFAVKGCDNSGRPAVFIYAARHNKNERDLEELKRLIIYTMETVLQMAQPHEERMVIVFDLSGFGMSCMDYDALKMLVNILSYNYPETLSVSYVVNAPFLFWGCWGLIKPWLDPVTAAKVQFVKQDNLSSYFDEAVLSTSAVPSAANNAYPQISKSTTATTEMNSVASESAGDLTALGGVHASGSAAALATDAPTVALQTESS